MFHKGKLMNREAVEKIIGLYSFLTNKIVGTLKMSTYS